MKQVTFIFRDHFITAKDPKAVDLCISMLPYSELEVIEVVDDDGSTHYFKVTRLVNQPTNSERTESPVGNYMHLLGSYCAKLNLTCTNIDAYWAQVEALVG